MQKHYQTVGYIEDGIINTKLYRNIDKTPLRILWILKEINGRDPGECWDLRTFLNIREEGEGLFSYKKWKATYSLVIKVSSGLIQQVSNYQLIPRVDKKSAEILSQIAVINIKKSPGQKSSKETEIALAFKENKNILFDQIRDINPQVIIGGSTLHHFYNNNLFISKEDFKQNPWGTKKDGRIWIDAYHPNQRMITHRKYYEEVWKAVQSYLSMPNFLA